MIRQRGSYYERSSEYSQDRKDYSRYVIVVDRVMEHNIRRNMLRGKRTGKETKK